MYIKVLSPAVCGGKTLALILTFERKCGRVREYEKDVISVLYMIRKRPPLYLGDKSVTKLKIFLDGFSIGYSYPELHSFFQGFPEYISDKYNCRESISWSDILLINANGDEEKAFDNFFTEWDIFLKENQQQGVEK